MRNERERVKRSGVMRDGIGDLVSGIGNGNMVGDEKVEVGG